MAPSAQALLRHLIVGGLWHPVKRKAEKELIVEMTQGRYSSFPFISPDTFRALCDVVIEDNQIRRRPRLASRSVIFFDLSEIEGTETRFDDAQSLALLRTELEALSNPPVVIMSHGDLLPSQILLKDIAIRSARLFVVNSLSENEKITAIPLGLENFSRNMHGRLRDFLGYLEGQTSLPRTRDVFASFEPENNALVRNPLVELLNSSRFGWSPRRLSPERYRQAVKESLFVLSPPGRGYDCHRTWEAIYLGAVPVVLEGTLPPGLLQGLPILSVSSYENFFSLSSSAMTDLFHEVRSVKLEKAYMPFWVHAVMASANE